MFFKHNSGYSSTTIVQHITGAAKEYAQNFNRTTFVSQSISTPLTEVRNRHIILCDSTKHSENFTVITLTIQKVIMYPA